jgi:spore germination protein
MSITKMLRKLVRRPKKKPTRRGIPKGLAAKLAKLDKQFEKAEDLLVRKFAFGPTKIPAAIAYFKGMVDDAVIRQGLLRNAMLELRQVAPGKEHDEGSILEMVKQVVTVAEMEQVDKWEDIIAHLLSGHAILMVEGMAPVLSIDVTGWEHRGVEQPIAEAVIRGPRDSFTESIRINITLIRRRLRDRSLKVEMYKLGSRTRTDVALMYIADIIDPEVLAEAQKRLEAIKLDAILDSGYIEELIDDCWWSPFTTTQETERPDEVVAGLLEGRFAIVVDNSPFVVLAPTTINTIMQSPEDYYMPWMVVSLVRLVRFVGSFISLTLPAVYISLIGYHPEMIPSRLAQSIAVARDGIPFPSATEAFLLEMALELLREAGIRVPGPIGQSIGIVGGIIIGDAAVRAGLVGPVMVIVVAATAISSLLVPTYSFALALRNLRFVLMLLASFFGLFGVSMGMLAILAHLAALKSFGVSMLSPWSPLRVRDLQDSLIRLPRMALHRRPGLYQVQDPTRQEDELPEGKDH